MAEALLLRHSVDHDGVCPPHTSGHRCCHQPHALPSGKEHFLTKVFHFTTPSQSMTHNFLFGCNFISLLTLDFLMGFLFTLLSAYRLIV